MHFGWKWTSISYSPFCASLLFQNLTGSLQLGFRAGITPCSLMWLSWVFLLLGSKNIPETHAILKWIATDRGIFTGVAVEMWGEKGWDTGFHCWALAKGRLIRYTAFCTFLCSLRDLVDGSGRCILGFKAGLLRKQTTPKYTWEKIW